LKLVIIEVQWQNRAHFYGIAAQIMRRILIDHARQHLGPQRVAAMLISLEEVCSGGDEHAAELVALDDALKELEKVDKRKSQVVELRYFGGLSADEISTGTRSFFRHDYARLGDVQRHSCAGTKYGPNT
jgi:RNA polymerase sigma factor (TIGR02999 family)